MTNIDPIFTSLLSLVVSILVYIAGPSQRSIDFMFADMVRRRFRDQTPEDANYALDDLLTFVEAGNRFLSGFSQRRRRRFARLLLAEWRRCQLPPATGPEDTLTQTDCSKLWHRSRASFGRLGMTIHSSSLAHGS